jgi:hypothetical protein
MSWYQHYNDPFALSHSQGNSKEFTNKNRLIFSNRYVILWINPPQMRFNVLHLIKRHNVARLVVGC